MTTVEFQETSLFCEHEKGSSSSFQKKGASERLQTHKGVSGYLVLGKEKDQQTSTTRLRFTCFVRKNKKTTPEIVSLQMEIINDQKSFTVC